MLTTIPFLPEQASTIAWQVDAVYLVLIGLSLFFGLGIISVITYFVLKYRRGRVADRSGATSHNLKLELVWTLIPLSLALTMFTWAATVFFEMSSPPADSLEIYVVGKQWMWKFQHPEGPQEINELHVPLGRPVRLVMISQDVIHSFYVPAFRVKMDVLPGRYTSLWFEATQTGEYHLFCAEYCGTDHAKMIGRVVVMDPVRYQEWLSRRITGEVRTDLLPEGPVDPMAAAGEQLFVNLGCQACHRPDAAVRAPSLIGLFGSTVLLDTGETVVADENYIRESILNPMAKITAGYDPIMPSYEGQVTEEQLLQLIAYIKALSDIEGGGN